jgi:hypothetical protein
MANQTERGVFRDRIADASTHSLGDKCSIREGEDHAPPTCDQRLRRGPRAEQVTDDVDLDDPTHDVSEFCG